MTFGPSARVTIDGVPRGTQPCAIPTPIGVLLPIATATTPSNNARRPANRARAGPPAAPPASGIAPPATAYAQATISAWSPACESTNSSTIRWGAPSTVATAFAVASRPAARGSLRCEAPTPVCSDMENAIAEQPVSTRPAAPMAAVPVMPATEAPRAASRASAATASGSASAAGKTSTSPGSRPSSPIARSTAWAQDRAPAADAEPATRSRMSVLAAGDMPLVVKRRGIATIAAFRDCETSERPTPLHPCAAPTPRSARSARLRTRPACCCLRGGRAVRRLERAAAGALASVRSCQSQRLQRRPRPVRRQDRPPDDEPPRRACVVVRPRRDLLAHVPAGHGGVQTDDRRAVLRRHAVRQLRRHALRSLLLRRVRRLGRGPNRTGAAGVAGCLRHGEGGCRLGFGRPPARDQRARAARPAARALLDWARQPGRNQPESRPRPRRRHPQPRPGRDHLRDRTPLRSDCRRLEPADDARRRGNLPVARRLAGEGLAERGAARGGAHARGARARRRRDRTGCDSGGPGDRGGNAVSAAPRRARGARRLLRRSPRRRVTRSGHSEDPTFLGGGRRRRFQEGREPAFLVEAGPVGDERLDLTRVPNRMRRWRDQARPHLDVDDLRRACRLERPHRANRRQCRIVAERGDARNPEQRLATDASGAVELPGGLDAPNRPLDRAELPQALVRK